MVTKAAMGDALHQAGRLKEAREWFEKAERDQMAGDPARPLLYRLQGYRFSDLLLSLHETEEVLRRVKITAGWESREGFRVGYALNRLMHARARLTPVNRPLMPDYDSIQAEIDECVAELRYAGQVEFLVLGLLARASANLATGIHSAVSDLDEAWEIAERGPMKLHMADIHLCRARLFGLPIADCQLPIEERKYPWESPAADLAAAEILINACGYHRRDPELTDAKQAILSS
jgi:hypothetical protein